MVLSSPLLLYKSSIVLFIFHLNTIMTFSSYFQLERRYFNDLDLLQKLIYFHLEPDTFYRGNIIITLQDQYKFPYFLYFLNKQEKWSFPYKNDIKESKLYLQNVQFIISFLTNKKHYPSVDKLDFTLEFTKIS
jgi:hypothetical protein